MFPYIIWAPPFDRRSGGCKVLHALAHELNVRGITAYLNTSAQNPPWRSPSLTNDPAISAIASSGAIAIYPEIIFGNPFNCRTVVRWVLNIPGKISGPKEYPSEDLVYIFTRSYDVFGGLEDKYVLHYPQVELDIFYDMHLPRKGVCFYVGKGAATPRIPETAHATEITRGWPVEQKDLADLFRKSELFIVYDNATSLQDNARLCGCPVVHVPGYCSLDGVVPELGWDGMGWGMQELEKAKATMNSEKLRQEYIRLKEIFSQRLGLFIEDTQKIAEERNK